MSKIKCRFCNSILNDVVGQCVDNDSLFALKCNDCGLVQLSSFSHVTKTMYEGQKYADLTWDSRNNEILWNKKRIHLLTKLLPELKNMNGLDYGCGAGGFLEYGRNELKNLIGYDINPYVCKQNNEFGFDCVNELKEIQFDPEILLLFHVLEHIKHPWELIRDILIIFKRIKKIVIEVPNFLTTYHLTPHLSK